MTPSQKLNYDMNDGRGSGSQQLHRGFDYRQLYGK